MVFASSSSIYGNSEKLPKSESDPVNPMSPYAVSKYAGERLTLQFHELYGLETVALRYFNVFGPYQDPKSQYAAVIPRFITAVLNNTPPTIYGDGLQSRGFTYVDNVVHANIQAMTVPDAPGNVMNIACYMIYVSLIKGCPDGYEQSPEKTFAVISGKRISIHNILRQLFLHGKELLFNTVKYRGWFSEEVCCFHYMNKPLINIFSDSSSLLITKLISLT